MDSCLRYLLNQPCVKLAMVCFALAKVTQTIDFLGAITCPAVDFYNLMMMMLVINNMFLQINIFKHMFNSGIRGNYESEGVFSCFIKVHV